MYFPKVNANPQGSILLWHNDNWTTPLTLRWFDDSQLQHQAYLRPHASAKLWYSVAGFLYGILISFESYGVLRLMGMARFLCKHLGKGVKYNL